MKKLTIEITEDEQGLVKTTSDFKGFTDAEIVGYLTIYTNRIILQMCEADKKNPEPVPDIASGIKIYKPN